jgi:cobaltochelatase CobS
MSIYIKIIRSNNPVHNHGEALYADAKLAVQHLKLAGVIDNDASHHSTAIRRAVKGKKIKVEYIKGTVKESRRWHIPIDGTPASVLPESTRKWLKSGEETEDEQQQMEKQFEQLMSTDTETEAQEEAVITEVKKMNGHTKHSAVPLMTPEQLAQSFTTEQGNPFAMMAQMIAPFVKPDLNFLSAELNRLMAEAVANLKPDRIIINYQERETTIKGHTHKQFKKVLGMIASGINPYLVGGAGSGKTMLVHQASEALGLPFYAMSVGQQTTKSDIFGYTDANSNYKPTTFRKAYEEGGVFLFDEIDAGNAGVLTSINAALANGVCGFPDRMIPKHKDFICAAAANTYGRGADRLFVGRVQLDGATLDRFIPIEIDYDEELELEISGNRDWARRVQRFRAKAYENKCRIIISPRASIYGAKLLQQGFTESEVIEMCIYKGCDDATRTILKSAL